MPRTFEQYSEIRALRRRQIMDTALELFANQGYHTTSIRKIALDAGIAKGLIYNYFNNKEDLVRAIIHQGIDRMLNVFDIDKDGILTDDELKYFIHENFKSIRNNVPFWKLYYGILMHPAVSKMVDEEFKEYLPAMTLVLIKYFRQKGSAHPEMEAAYFNAVLDGISVQFILDPINYPLDQMIQMAINKISDLS